jgi:uncharacterized protein (DUF58 family)
MADGLIAELAELIRLKQYASAHSFSPKRQALQTGNHLSALRGRGMEFSEVRNYQAGDEIRHMEWRVTARTGRPHVKCYEEERERPVMLLVDFNPSMLFGTRMALKSVIAARLASLLAWSTVKQGDRIGGLLYSATAHQEYTPKSRESAVLPLLGALSQFTKQSPWQTTSPTTLQEALQRLRRVVKSGSVVALISDFYTWDPHCFPSLSRLCSTNRVLLYHICDFIELTPPKPEAYPITDLKEESVLDMRSKIVTKAYKTFCQERVLILQKLCKRLLIPYNPVTPETDLVQLLRATFPGRSHGK